MGERGAPRDPLNNIGYCRHCGRYCVCDGYGHQPDTGWSDEDWSDQYLADQGAMPEQTRAESEPESTETDDWTATAAVVGAIAVGAVVAIGLAIKSIFD